jgi:hypothetical protein
MNRLKILEKESNLPKIKPIKEIMDIYIPDIAENLPRRNGSVYTMIGSGGSGKSSLLLSMFKSKQYYRSKYDNIYLFVPISSFMSVEKHPFQNHDKVYHELTSHVLDDIYDELIDLKQNSIENDFPLEYNLIIVDDFASNLKDNELIKKLNQMIVKTRHLNCSWIFTLQAYNLFPMVLRKQITYATIFKPKNNKEMDSIGSELLNMNKDESLQLFNYVFDENYNHLDIDTVENKKYKNFNLLTIDN